MRRCPQCGRRHSRSATIYCCADCCKEYEKSVKGNEVEASCPPGELLKAMRRRFKEMYL